MNYRLSAIAFLCLSLQCSTDREFEDVEGAAGSGGSGLGGAAGGGDTSGGAIGQGGLGGMLDDVCATKDCECVPGERRCDGTQPQLCDEGIWTADGSECGASQQCSAGECVSFPSCDGLADSCGPLGTGSCCESLWVPGGTFNRSDDAEAPATVSAFRLDKYEITVGRFRNFVEAVVGGWEPEVGAGKHSHLNDGEGLVEGGDSANHEQGWDSNWDDQLPSDTAGWNTSLDCSADYATWTPSAGSNETRPINCITWHQAYAFCIWDGGFLPSEAEWNYAAAGGDQQRSHAWQTGGLDPSRANYDCQWYGGGTCSSVLNIAPVGSLPDGDGRWGQSDLMGNLAEMVLEPTFEQYPVPCNDCLSAATPSTSGHLTRGGSFEEITSQGGASKVSTWQRVAASGSSSELTGARCARSP